jgi:hypothetical protein
MAAAQKPVSALAFGQSVGQVAWRTIPSWFLVTLDDQAIDPDLQRAQAQRAGARTFAIHSSHVPFVSHPCTVVGVIDLSAFSTR